MKGNVEGWALVESVRRSKVPGYPWQVCGVMLAGAGKSAGNRFAWLVTSLEWQGYNWSRCSKPDGSGS